MSKVLFGFVSWELLFFVSFFHPSTSFEFSLGPTSSASPNITKTYDRNFRPNHGAVADMLSLSLQTLSVHGVTEEESQFGAEVAIKTSWTDPRLLYGVNRSTTFVGGIPNIWFPPLYILDANDEADGTYVTLKPSGEVELIQRHTAKIQCEFVFAKLPFDLQECLIQFKSHAFSTLQLDMVWNSRLDASSVRVYDAQFSLSSVSQTTDKIRDESGSEARILSVVLKLRRNPTKYLKVVIFPGIIFTFLTYMTLIMAQGTSALQRSTAAFILFLAYHLSTQLYYSGSSNVGGANFTACDVWILIATTIQIVVLVCNLNLLLESTNSESDEKSKSCGEKTRKFLITGIPIGVMIFLIIYFTVYLI